MSIPNLQKLLHTILLRSPTNLFDEFINECTKWYSQPAHTFTEMRTRDNKKIRGDIFEDFCVDIRSTKSLTMTSSETQSKFGLFTNW